MGDERRKIGDFPTAGDYRERVEQATGIDFEPDSPFQMTRQDWKNLAHFHETVVENADNSETESR